MRSRLLCLPGIVLTILALFFTAALAETVSVQPYGISTPYWYGYSAGAKASYYLAAPTLSANDTAVGLAATQTLTNKTLTSPVLTSPTITGGTLGSLTGAAPIVLEGATANDYETTIAPTDPTADRTITLPDATGVVILANAVPEAANAVWGTANGFYIEGSTADGSETALIATNPTADRTITLPDYTGGVPVVVQQGYTQFSHSEATTVDVTGAALTLADGWFTEGKTFRVKAGGTVTGANGTVTVGLYLEDGLVCTLTTGDAAAGDWTAEFQIVATAAATQRVIGTLIAGAGADPKSDYGADTTDTATAGTIPLKLQVGLAHADDAITVEYWSIEYWEKAD